MTKLDWHHVIHLFHFLGIALIMSLPVTSLALWTAKPSGDLRVITKFGELLGRMDVVARVGALIVLVTGIGQIWAHEIAPGDIFTHQIWLAIKLVLFALFLLNGVFLAGPALRKRVELLRELGTTGQPLTAEQDAAVQQSYRMTQITGSVMMLLLLGILVMVFFQPFTTNPK